MGVTRGEPNSVTFHFASKPSAAIVEVSGSTEPMKLGEGQAERTVALRSFAAEYSVNELVPRSDTAALKVSRVESLEPNVSGALASTQSAWRQTASCRSASRHGTHVPATPSIAMLSEAERPARRARVPNAIIASLQKKRPSLSLTNSRRRASAGTANAPSRATLVS